MSNLNQQLEQLHKPVDKTLLRVLSLILGFVNVGLFMWSPDQYADAIGGFSPFLGLLFVLSVCASMVFGVGFRPRFWLWQAVFSPYLSLTVLSYLTLMYVI
ncbi:MULTISPECIES: cyd operon protein YbgE [Vibrio]|uniref:Cyd operon protein YbgE n=2 Tax=Vibrio TaxID=662 RepID=A0A2C9PCJ3_9VIBR|nr:MULTISPECIES: cyd operon protein YbgE [Vibrio]ASI90471.1 cyd operon protein YbgE [Vibrio mediterranei]AYV22478.1 cyd operon protein YbgE [Vibrio mediterranei]EDL51081.1 hypothetical protein VSAK1_00415 [Vibrio mediterranei AK1]KFA96051.1 cytochrome bd biosynthesis protein [Vibrio sp. ER1A]MCF4174561.1 cyd operon protein YbgE [Vibrio sp. McD22-P3]